MHVLFFKDRQRISNSSIQKYPNSVFVSVIHPLLSLCRTHIYSIVDLAASYGISQCHNFHFLENYLFQTGKHYLGFLQVAECGSVIKIEDRESNMVIADHEPDITITKFKTTILIWQPRRPCRRKINRNNWIGLECGSLGSRIMNPMS